MTFYLQSTAQIDKPKPSLKIKFSSPIFVTIGVRVKKFQSLTTKEFQNNY